MKGYTAFDIGGTQIKHGIMDEAGILLEKDQYRSPASEGGQAILSSVLEVIARDLSRFELLGVCISTMGVVDSERGEITYASNTAPGYAGTSYKGLIESRFGIPCEVENDVNCAGLAEYRCGAGKGSKNMVCLTVGTGIGGCAVLDGKILHGASGSAMEVGYLLMGGKEFQEIGATSVMCRKVAGRKQDSPENWDGKRIFEAARQGDRVCEEAIDEMCDVLGRGIGDICYVLNPDVVVLGGGIMVEQDYLEPRIDRALKRYLKPVAYEALTLRFAACRNDAGMIGAFYHFMDRQGQKVSKKK